MAAVYLLTADFRLWKQTKNHVEKNRIFVGGKDFSATVPADAEVERRVVLDNFFYAPIGEGRQVGRIEYRADGELLGAVPLIAAADAPERQYQRGFFDWIKDLFTHG